jgi:CMP-N-acetylneuraminic acid synthetase
LQPTTPFRSVAEIRQVKAKLLENSIESQSFFSVKDASDSHPARMYESSGPGRFQGIHCYEEYREYRRQDCPKIFIRDGGYYIIGRDLIKERKQTASLANGIVRDFPYSINIDSESDLLLSQLLLDKITDDPNGLESS